MGSLADRLMAAGVELSPLLQAGEQVSLHWDTKLTGPILGDGALIAIPDAHLGDGGPGDVFLGMQQDTNVGRLERLLRALEILRESMPDLSIVQLGDLYDVWRAYPEYRDHPGSDYDRIHAKYGALIGHLTQTLGARVCVGNHDATLGLYPPSWARTPDGVSGQLAYGHLFAEGRVIAFHGHQEEVLREEMQAQGGSSAVKAATLAARLSKPLSQWVEEKADLVNEFVADPEWSFGDFVNGVWPAAPPPPGPHGFLSPRWCLRVGHDRFEKLVSKLPGAEDLRLVLVGHSHLPGISMMDVGGRLVPLVDVGSWIQGKSQIAVVEEGSLTIQSVV